MKAVAYSRISDVDSARHRHKNVGLEAFHVKCLRQIAKIRWQDHVRNTDVSSLTGLSPVLDPIVRRRSSLFGHVARLPEDTPAHQALRYHTDLSLGRLADPSWRWCPGRPRNRWLDQLCRDNSTSPADLWRRGVTRGHSGVNIMNQSETMD